MVWWKVQKGDVSGLAKKVAGHQGLQLQKVVGPKKRNLRILLKQGTVWESHQRTNLVTGSVALMDFITYLVTKIIFIKSNIGDPTLEI